ncbi:MAG: hypothetical protein ACOX8X_03960 [Methanomethylophilus sp.]|jgi:hypothetical protein
MSETAEANDRFSKLFARKAPKEKPLVSSENVPKLLNESPRVIGIMSTPISGGGSLDTAVREVAASGPPLSRGIFGKVVDRADTRAAPDIRAALLAEMSELPDSASSYSMAMHMAVSASEARDREERDRNLRDATEIALTGLRETGKAFSASLSAPCMAVFALGIMIPMVLMSIVPMLSIGGLFGSSPLSMTQISVFTIVIIPAAVAAVVLGIKHRNPFLPPDQKRADLKVFLPLLSVPLLFLLLSYAGISADIAGCIACAIGGAISYACVLPAHMRETARKRCAAGLEDAVFDAGNRLISGEGFEDAVLGALNAREQCREAAESLRREWAICRGDTEGAIMRALSPISLTAAEAFRSICRAASKDLRDAGRLAVSIGRQMKDQRSVRNSIRSDLRSITDTMSATAAFFAPMVLGLSVAMLAPVSFLSGADFSGTSSVLVLYLAELCVLIAALNSFLEGDSRPETVARRISMFLPISAIVFLLSMSVQL